VTAAPARTALDVGIIGCGTAGAATAIGLARAGHRVTVYEKVADPGPAGAGIVLQPTGMYALSRLGLLDAVVSRGARIDRLVCETPSRWQVVNLAYASLRAGLFGLGIHRGVIFEQLIGAVRAESVELKLGVGVEDLAAAPSGGSYVVGMDGTRYGPHELIVIADGARSRMRDDTSLTATVREYPWGALWFVAPDPERRFHGRLHQVVRGTRRMLGFLPTGLGPGADAGPSLVSLFWSIRGDRVDAWRRAPLADWKREVLEFVPAADAVLDQITDPNQLIFTTYKHVTMPRWNTDHVVYVGDAAHAMSPQLGQGCNLALFDAMTLVGCVAGHLDVASALAAYSANRLRHLRFYQFATKWLTPFFQSDSWVLGWLRDAGMGVLGRLGWVRRTMVRTMTGIERGFVRAPMDLEPLVAAIRDAKPGA